MGGCKFGVLVGGALFAAMFGCLVSPVGAGADNAPAAAGQYGVVIHDHVAVRERQDGAVLRHAFASEALFVLEVNDRWLHVRGGWVAAADVISPPKAIEYFTSAIERTPTSLAYACRARAYLLLGRSKDALADAKRAVETDADYPPAWYSLGAAHSKNGSIESAVKSFEEAVRRAPNFGRAHRSLGWAFVEKKQYRAAVSAFNAAVLNGAGDADTFCARGGCLTLVGEPQRAVEDFTRAIELGRPPEPYFYTNRAAAYVLLQKYDSALGDANRAVDMVDPPVHELTVRATVRAHKGDRDGALRDFARSIEIEPNQAEAFSSRARINVYAHHLDDALADAEQALRHDPNDAMAFFARGAVYRLHGDNARALDELNKSVAIEPRFATSRAWRGWASLIVGDYAEAQKDLTTAIEIDPLYAAPHHYLAWLYAVSPDPMFRDGEQALAHAKRALELSRSPDGDAHMVLAAAYAELGDFPAALRYLDKAEKCKKDNPAALKSIADQREEYKKERRWPLVLPEPTRL